MYVESEIEDQQNMFGINVTGQRQSRANERASRDLDLHVSSSRVSLAGLRCPLPSPEPVLAALDDDDTTTAFSLALVVCV